MEKPVLIFGAGGLGKLALEIFQSNDNLVYGYRFRPVPLARQKGQAPALVDSPISYASGMTATAGGNPLSNRYPSEPIRAATSRNSPDTRHQHAGIVQPYRQFNLNPYRYPLQVASGYRVTPYRYGVYPMPSSWYRLDYHFPDNGFLPEFILASARTQ